jgi:hypothetical protein
VRSTVPVAPAPIGPAPDESGAELLPGVEVADP